MDGKTQMQGSREEFTICNINREIARASFNCPSPKRGAFGCHLSTSFAQQMLEAQPHLPAPAREKDRSAWQVGMDNFREMRFRNKFQFHYIHFNPIYPHFGFKEVGAGGAGVYGMEWVDAGTELARDTFLPLPRVRRMIRHILLEAVKQVRTLPEQRCALAVKGATHEREFLKTLWSGQVFDLDGLYLPSIDQMPAGILNCLPACGKNFHINIKGLDEGFGGELNDLTYPWCHWFLSKPGKKKTKGQPDTKYGCVHCPLTEVQLYYACLQVWYPFLLYKQDETVHRVCDTVYVMTVRDTLRRISAERIPRTTWHYDAVFRASVHGWKTRVGMTPAMMDRLYDTSFAVLYNRLVERGSLPSPLWPIRN